MKKNNDTGCSLLLRSSVASLLFALEKSRKAKFIIVLCLNCYEDFFVSVVARKLNSRTYGKRKSLINK